MRIVIFSLIMLMATMGYAAPTWEVITEDGVKVGVDRVETVQQETRENFSVPMLVGRRTTAINAIANAEAEIVRQQAIISKINTLLQKAKDVGLLGADEVIIP